MNKLKLLIGIILVFVLGALAGSLGTGIYIQHRFERFVFDDSRQARPPHPPMMRFLMKRLDRELDLTETQKSEIERSIKQTFDNIHAIMRKQHPELEKLVEENLEQIKEILNPVQREKFESLKLFERMKKRIQGKRSLRRDFSGQTPEKIFASLKECLKLSEAEEKKVRPIIEENIKKRLKILETYREEARRNRDLMRNEMRELQKAAEKQLEKVLSDEQMDLFRQFHEDKPMFMHGGMLHPEPFGLGGPLEIK